MKTLTMGIAPHLDFDRHIPSRLQFNIDNEDVEVIVSKQSITDYVNVFPGSMNLVVNSPYDIRVHTPHAPFDPILPSPGNISYPNLNRIFTCNWLARFNKLHGNKFSNFILLKYFGLTLEMYRAEKSLVDIEANKFKDMLTGHEELYVKSAFKTERRAWGVLPIINWTYFLEDYGKSTEHVICIRFKESYGGLSECAEDGLVFQELLPPKTVYREFRVLIMGEKRYYSWYETRYSYNEEPLLFFTDELKQFISFFHSEVKHLSPVITMDMFLKHDGTYGIYSFDSSVEIRGSEKATKMIEDFVQHLVRETLY